MLTEIKIIKTGPSHSGGDEIITYQAKFDENPTLQHFVAWVLQERPNEWGDIRLGHLPIIKYTHGKIAQAHPLFEEWLGKTIELTTYSGGWTRSDYYIRFVD